MVSTQPNLELKKPDRPDIGGTVYSTMAWGFIIEVVL
jgi:hypothetical protein